MWDGRKTYKRYRGAAVEKARGLGKKEQQAWVTDMEEEAPPPPKVPTDVAIKSRREGERGRVLYIVTFEYDGKAREAARYYSEFSDLREGNATMRAVKVPFPGRPSAAAPAAR